jgi:superfamily II DNA/RNA helicase
MNPVALAHKVEETYRRYLRTTFYFKDPKLRASFEDALRSGCLSKGPYLEATPMFKRGATPNRFFGSLLGFEPDLGFIKAVQGERPLYFHQEEAIRRVVDNHNIVVATGTGSGKTECFLYPILLHLYREFQAGTLCPGVRALVLYPMNALANDQRDRLGEICRELTCGDSRYRFTFGQYIGETPEDENDSQRHAHDHMAKRLAGELVLRSEMRTTPPHILLTNYSMLEYLLLRPTDSPLFDDGHARWWTFLVLDEAHQYRGAKGIEMAMLVRRLKQRLREGGCESSFRCLATSATLMSGKEDKSAVAKFASDLFGEVFKEQDIILAETEDIPEPGEAELNRDVYNLLLRVLNGDSIKQLEGIASVFGLAVSEDDDRAKTVGRLLQRDRRTNRLRHLVTGNPTEVQSIADYVFADLPETERVNALSELVTVLLRAKDPASGAPLLSARYHLFLRSLEGAFLTFWPNEQVLLDRRKAVDTELFEVGLCRECGQHYLVGKVVNNRLTEAVRDPGRADFGATFFLPLKDLSEDDDKINNNTKEKYRLCVQCGEIRDVNEQLHCNHNTNLTLQKQAEAEEREDQIPRCAVCGYQAPDPVREVVHGTDGPHAVIVTTLCQELPQTRKKVLAFADGRQEAAFFAWYLEKSYKDIRDRNLVLKAVQRQAADTPEGSSIQDLATGLSELFRERNVFGAATSDLQVRREAWLASYREFLTDEPRISLEGVGLGSWYLRWPDWFEIPEILRTTPWSLSEQEIRDVILILLDSMRTSRAVELRAGNHITLNWSDLGLQARQQRFSIGAPGKQIGLSSWDGKRTRRACFMAKLLMRLEANLKKEEGDDSAVRAVRAVWEAFQKCDERAPTTGDRLLMPVADARRLNPDWWRFRFLARQDLIYRCDTCGRIQVVNVRGLCPRHRCPGSLKEIRRQELDLNHYRLLYEAELPGSLRVEEHTAQLDKEKAREFQRAFREGKIHVLSCSTTFELGVDLGDLDTIFLRNVPPEAFNYAQRVGRSGRRSGHPGFAITYCKRGPHDLYHFAEPQRMLMGRVQPPVLALCNERIITRQTVAVALSFFFRSLPERFARVESLFVDLNSPKAVADFREFLLNNQFRIEETIRSVVPLEMAGPLGLSDGTWIEKTAGRNSRLALAETEASSDYRAVVALKENAKSRDDFRTAEWAQRRAETIAKEEVLSFLSRKTVIPKYGFPVDVVELDTQRTQQNQEAFEVSLQRDLSIAISEFAPTSKLVANKKEWVSYGLKKVAEREWERKFYSHCLTHNVFLQWNQGDPPPVPMPCGCQPRPWKYVIPKFGFVTDRDKPKEPKSRPAKVFSTRPYFAGPIGPEPPTITMPLDAPLVTIKKASPGQMVVLCEGRRGEGFYLCSGCGAGFRSRPRNHKTPQGQNCQGVPEQVSLGHEFVTDVLQLQFHAIQPHETSIVWFAYSLAYTIVEGAAEVLEVPSSDLSATVAHSDWNALPPIILYDNVPGGAGLVARLEQEDVINDCLHAALKRVDGSCGCAPNTSCYGCLRGYRNQFAHQFLQRGPVHEYLISVCTAWRR